MNKAAMLIMIGVLFPQSAAQGPDWTTCMESCRLERPNPELRVQEIVALEKETVRAIQNHNGTFFRRVYSDDFSGILSHGQAVSKNSLIDMVQGPEANYDAVVASDIHVHLFRDTAVATCAWTLRGSLKGQRISSQMRMIHVYVYGSSGFRVVTSQATPLPPYGQEPL